VLEHRDRTEGEQLVDEAAPVVDDPRRISDDGTVTRDEETLRQVLGPTTTGAPTTTVAPTTVAPEARPEVAETVTTKRGFTWGQALIILAGVASLVFGIGAIALAGLAGSITEPVVNVFGFDHTPLLGVIECGTGVALILAALIPGGRWVAGPIGVAAIAGGALIYAEYDWTQTELAAEQDFAWVPIAIGAVAYLGAMVPTKKRVTVTR
jgi:hypothetical protein